MGSGKTTVGELLAQWLGVTHRDTDDDVVAAAGRTIPEIFAEKGEKAFRDLERDALLSALERTDPAVISCGGGAILRPENRAVLRDTPTVFLDEDVDALYRRTRDPGRPLRGASREDFGRRLAERLPLYREVADLTVRADGRSAAAVAGEVERWLRTP